MRQTPEQKQKAMVILVRMAIRQLGDDWLDEPTEEDKQLLYGLLNDLES
jgi:hypothetical protein